MSPEPDANFVGAAGLPIQPEEQARDAGDGVPVNWVTEFAAEARDLDRIVEDLQHRERLAGDAELVMWLALNGFQGRDYDEFANELAKYGLGVMVAWIRKGVIFGKCRDRGIVGLPEPPTGALTAPDIAEELAYETVARALAYFRSRVLMTGKWNPAKGASLKTYFIGQCLFQFRDVYRAWRQQEFATALLVDDHNLLENGSGTDTATSPWFRTRRPRSWRRSPMSGCKLP